MADVIYYAYRTFRDVNLDDTRMGADPNTGDFNHLHAAGDVISFDSEEDRDEYIKRGYVYTTLPDGRVPKTHGVHVITTEEAVDFLESCAASKGCIHRGFARKGTTRIPAD